MLVSSPITIVLYIVLIGALVYTGVGRVLARRRQKQVPGEAAAEESPVS